MEPDQVPLKDMCKSRWGDWIRVPNFHLGNSWTRADGKCLAPCPGDNDVPDVGYAASEDLPARCVSRKLHRGGTSEPVHCADAWIHRLGISEDAYVAEASGGFLSVTDEDSDRVAVEQRARKEWAEMRAAPRTTLAADLAASKRSKLCDTGNLARETRSREICANAAAEDEARGEGAARTPQEKELRAACYARFPEDFDGFRGDYSEIARRRAEETAATDAAEVLGSPDDFWISRVFGRVPGKLLYLLLLGAALLVILWLFGDALVLVAQFVAKAFMVYAWPQMKKVGGVLADALTFVSKTFMDVLKSGTKAMKEGMKDNAPPPAEGATDR